MRPVVLLAALISGGVLAGPALAEPVHLRGTVTSVDGGKVAIHTREGKTVSLMLGDAFKISGIAKGSMADVKPGSFIGTANAPEAAGAKALEVVVFPEAMRGVGEGDHDWDLEPKSRMTNATVSNPVEGVDGRTVTLTYKGGQKKVTIAPDTPIVTIVPATAADVVPGSAVFVGGETDASGGTVEKGFIAVGKDGIVPPM